VNVRPPLANGRPPVPQLPLGTVTYGIVRQGLAAPGPGQGLAAPGLAAVGGARGLDEAVGRVVLHNRHGLIRIRTLSRPNVMLGAVVVVLALLTAYTMLALDYGKTPFLAALSAMLRDFLVMMTQPYIDKHFGLGDVTGGLFVSLGLAVLTTFVGAALAFVLGLLAAANLSNRLVSNGIKAVMSFFRAVPTILWVLIFTVAIGLGPEAAVCGLLFHSVAFLVKAYSESFEEVDPGVIEALRASGASWWQTVFQAVVPEKTSEMLSWGFIRFEINFVNAVAVGAVAGAGGIGLQLFLAGSFYHNIHEVGFIVYLCLAVAAALELVATRLRRRYIRS
jgi:phosphonate transport system permease protein